MPTTDIVQFIVNHRQRKGK